jgi:WD40 repeat protein
LQIFSQLSGAVTCLAIGPDGRHIVSGSGGDGTVKVWGAHTGLEVLSLPVNALLGVTSVAFSPDGQRILSGSLDGQRLASSGSDGVVKVWEQMKRH